MASALDFDAIGAELIRVRLAACYEDRIFVDPALIELSKCADRTTLVGIAATLIAKSPPVWLPIAVENQKVYREFIPTDDLEDLGWIEPGLDEFLLSANSLAQRLLDDSFAKKLGDAAELILLAAFNLAGANPVHVAKVSDAYGYDIECRGTSTERVEVKAAGSSTRGSFYISRNEFDKSQAYGCEWRLIQLTFSNHAFIDAELNISHVESLLELSSEALRELVPSDTKFFRWTESARIIVPDRYWNQTNIELDPMFVTKGVRRGSCAGEG
jgi:hypothetical protein